MPITEMQCHKRSVWDSNIEVHTSLHYGLGEHRSTSHYTRGTQVHTTLHHAGVHRSTPHYTRGTQVHTMHTTPGPHHTTPGVHRSTPHYTRSTPHYTRSTSHYTRGTQVHTTLHQVHTTLHQGNTGPHHNIIYNISMENPQSLINYNGYSCIVVLCLSAPIFLSPACRCLCSGVAILCSLFP